MKKIFLISVVILFLSGFVLADMGEVQNNNNFSDSFFDLIGKIGSFFDSITGAFSLIDNVSSDIEEAPKELVVSPQISNEDTEVNEPEGENITSELDVLDENESLENLKEINLTLEVNETKEDLDFTGTENESVVNRTVIANETIEDLGNNSELNNTEEINETTIPLIEEVILDEVEDIPSKSNITEVVNYTSTSEPKNETNFSEIVQNDSEEINITNVEDVVNETEYFYWNREIENVYDGLMGELNIKVKIPKSLKNITDRIDKEKKPKGFFKGIFSTRSDSENKLRILERELKDKIKNKYSEVDVENIGIIKNIKFRDLGFEDNISLGAEELNEERFIQSYAIDPSQMNFTNATVTVIAKGERLYKCADWNFSEQKCYGEWVLFKEGLVPGEEYNFMLTKDDPGFGEEINITAASHLDENRSFISDIFNDIELIDGNWSEAVSDGEYVRVTFEENLTSVNDITVYARSNGVASVEVYEKDGDEVLMTFDNISEPALHKLYLDNLEGNQDTFDLKIFGASVEFDWITDPIYHTNSSSDIAIAPLTNTSFVIAWVDVNETDISFKVMDTNGTVILNTVDVDTDANPAYSRVSITNINSTHFVIAYVNTTNNVFAVYDTSGNLEVGPVIISESDGTSAIAPDISVAELGDRFAVGYTIPSFKDVYSSLYYNNGSMIGSPLQIDGSTGSNTPLWNTLEITAINGTMYNYVRHDTGPSDIFHGMISGITNTLMGSENSEDVNAGTEGQVSMTGLNREGCITFWYDNTDYLVEYMHHLSNGTNPIPPTTINGGVGASSRVGLATVRENASSTRDSFVAVWSNETLNSIWAAVYDEFGNEITAPFVAVTDRSSTYLLFDVAGRNIITNDTLYPGTFTIAYVNDTGSVFRNFYVNGSEWDGIVPIDIPAIDILYPINGSTYNSKSLFFRVDTSGNSLSDCWYNFNNVGNVTFNCGSEINITAVEGVNNLTAYVNNTNGLEGSDSISFTVNSSISLVISITSPPNGTISNVGTPQIKLLANDNDNALINYTLNIYYSNDTLYSVGNNGTLINNTETEITLNPALVLIGDLTNYKIIVNASDGVNNATSNILFYTLTNPAINLISPVNNYWNSDGQISFNFEVYDDAFTNISCSLFIDDVLNQTNSTSLTGGVITTFTVSGIEEGLNKNWSIYCIDSASNSGEASRVFNVDKTDPIINWINDTPDPVGAGQIINITANITDNLGIYYVTVDINGSVNFMDFAGSDIYYYEYNTTGKSGNYNYSVKAYDYAGNFFENDTGVFNVSLLTISLEDYYGLDSSFGVVDQFNTTNLEEIEYMELNFSLDFFETGLSSWYLNFTANGTNGCSLGNKQSSTCYSYPNWIQFINGSETATYDGTQGNQGDRIYVTQTGSGDSINLSFRIDEHYNPNVFKWYNALYNFSDVKWQSDAGQRITKNNLIKVEINESLIPLNADQYKIDARLDYSSTPPTDPLLFYLCNSSYTTGLPEDYLGCALVVSKLPGEFQDDGTKVRGVFTKNLIDTIGDLKYVILDTTIPNPNRYYFIKTYKATAPSYTTHWEHSDDDGQSWVNSGDGYETELNINWFYDGADPTEFVYSLWANTTSGKESFLEGNITWDIDPTNNYPPIVDIRNPSGVEYMNFPYNITFFIADSNDDNLNASLYLYQDGILNKTLATNMNQSNISYLWDDSTVDGNYSLMLKACELSTSDLFCSNTSRDIILDNTNPVVTDLIPVADSSYLGVLNLEISANVTDLNIGTVIANITFPDETSYQLILLNSLGDKFNRSFEPLISGRYNITIIATDLAGNVNNTEDTYFNFSDSTPPSVEILHPNGETFQEDSAVPLALNITDLTYIDTIIANITSPNGTNYSVSDFSNGLQSDDFEIDTEGVNWISKIQDLSTGHNCTMNINEDFSGRMFIGINGTGGAGQTHCGFYGDKRTYGDFDLNITFNITHIEDGAFFLLRSVNVDSFSPVSPRAFITLRQEGGALNYASGYTNETSTIQKSVNADEPYGKFRIKRFNSTSNGSYFNLFYWNNSDSSWEDIFGNVSISDSSMSQIIQIYTASLSPEYGEINATVEDFYITHENYTFALFNQTSIGGEYNVSFFVNDTGGNVNDTESTYFNIDLINEPPSRPYISNPYSGEFVNGLENISWTHVVDRENDNLQFNITLLNSDGTDNSSIVTNYGNINNTYYEWDTTSFQDGLYGLRVTVFENDTAEGYSHSDTLSGNFTIDNTNPLVYDLIPVSGQTFNATNTIEISANVTDNLGVDKVFANITCENGSSLLLELNNVLGDKYNNSFTIPNGECDGLYNISFIANDSAGNINNTEKTNFTAREHVAPEIQFDSTSTETGNYSQNYIFANVTASDANLDRVVIYLYNSMGLVESVSNNGNFSNNFTGLLDGTYYLNATANDTSLNINQTETRIILLDTVIPEIDFFSDTVDSENIIEDYIFVNISATDENLDTITIYLYNSTSLVGAIEDSSSFNFTNLPIENYYFNATVNDSAGNLNYTETRQVNIVEPAYSDNISIMDSSGNPLNVSFTILNPNNEIIYSDMGMSHIEGLVPGIYDVIITPQDNYFKEIRIDGINWTENMTELISLENPVENQGYNQLVSFNPTLNGNSIIENVTNMTMNFTASNVSGNRILYKCGEWNFTNHTCFGEWIPIRGILPGENYTFFTDNLTDPALAEGNGTFFEGFEGGESDNQSNAGYDNVNWTILGGGTWNPNEKDEFAGADALSVKGDTAGFAWNEINISTEGYSNIVLSVYYKIQGTFEAGEFLSLDWYNGTDWINEVNTSDITTYTLFNSTLASESENNPNFKIRLGCNVDATNEYCLWDNVQISASLADTCVYSGSGNWEINCSDNCVIDSNVDLLGNNISIIGFGNFTTIANITNWNDLFIEGDSSANRCEVYCANGGCFK